MTDINKLAERLRELSNSSGWLFVAADAGGPVVSEHAEVNAETRAQIAMHAVRLMRSGRYRLARVLRADLVKDFPGVPEEAIDRALATVARRMLDAEGAPC